MAAAVMATAVMVLLAAASRLLVHLLALTPVMMVVERTRPLPECRCIRPRRQVDQCLRRPLHGTRCK